VRILRPIPPSVTRVTRVLAILAWVTTMGVIASRVYLQGSTSLATDLARYGSDAQWHGVYYRGEKIGFTVRQVVPTDEGYELQEDGRLQMSLLGATTTTRLRTTARVDERFDVRSFDFELDPGTGATRVSGVVNGSTLEIETTTSAGSRRETRQLAAPPVLALSLGRRLASEGLKAGASHQWMVFDPATLQNAVLTANVGERTFVQGHTRQRIPAYEVSIRFVGLETTAWVTETGEVIREESPMGMITMRETADLAPRMTVVSGRARTDLLEAAAIVPQMKDRIDEPRDVRRARLRLSNADLSGFEIDGLNQSLSGDVVELRDPRELRPGSADPDVEKYLLPESLIESDDPAILAEAERAIGDARDTRARAERLVRHVNALLEKKPTVSLPSASEVLRTKVGDCNEHTALYVAMARSIGIPARIAVGLAYTRGAFYYHAWPEVYLAEGDGRGMWLPVDPTFNQYPADTMHLRMARGGLDRQSAILPLVGRLEISVLDLDIDPAALANRLLVGRQPASRAPLSLPLPSSPGGGGCWDFLISRR
jgi:hypothetical protein